MNYDVGDSVKLSAAFTNDTGAAADPTNVNAVVRSPSGRATGYTIADFTHPTVGQYALTVVVNESGRWRWRVVGSGAVTAAEEDTFYVSRML